MTFLEQMPLSYVSAMFMLKVSDHGIFIHIDHCTFVVDVIRGKCFFQKFEVIISYSKSYMHDHNTQAPLQRSLSLL
jgi:hypothetical protein